jgi:hypothetical protein
VATARGTLFLNSAEFVRRNFGPAAHDRALGEIAHDQAAVFTGPLHEGSWKPLPALVAYMEAAKRMFGAQDDLFYQRMGYFAGRHDREHRAFRVMMSDLDTATKMATILWRTFFDMGRLEVVDRDASSAVVRIIDFPAHRALCQRFVGSIEGQQSDLGAHAEEIGCVLLGAPCCEIRVSFKPR